MNPGHNATGQNATDKNNPAQYATRQNATRKKDPRTKCHPTNERPDKMPLIIALLQVCAELGGILSGGLFSAWHFVQGCFWLWHFVLWHFVRTPIIYSHYIQVINI